MSTPSTVNNLGNLYAKAKMAMAEKMYQRALDGYERLRGVGHPTTRTIRLDLNQVKKSGLC